MPKALQIIMWRVFSVVAFFSILESVVAQNQNETTQNQISNDIVGFGTSFARNLTSSISVSDDTDLGTNTSDYSSGKVNITDRIQSLEPNEKRENVVEFKISSQINVTGDTKKLDNFRPSPQLETYYEFNKFPVKPAYPEAKTIPTYIPSDDRKTFSREGLPAENDKSRTIDVFEPGYSAFGNVKYNNLKGVKSEYHGSTASANDNNGPSWGIQNKNLGDTPWISRVRFPTSPSTNDHNPYAFVEKPSNQKQNCCPENNRQTHQYAHTETNAQVNQKYNEYLPPADTNKPPAFPNNEYIVPEINNGHSVSVSNQRGEYLPPVPNFSSTAKGYGQSKDTPSYGSSGPGEGFNFNKLVEVPKKWFSGGQNTYTPQHKIYESPYNLMEKPSYEIHQKTQGGYGMSNPWKKILKLLATFIPVGLLISALTPTVITVTNVTDTNMQTSRYRSDDSKKELQNHILSSLEYFDKLNENGCENRVFCELLVTASRTPDSERQVHTLLDNYVKQDLDYKSRAEELKRVFEAVRNQDCEPISCDYIKDST